VPKAPGSGHPRKPQIAAAIIEAKAARAAECIGLCSAAKADVPGHAFVMRTMRQMPFKLRVFTAGRIARSDGSAEPPPRSIQFLDKPPLALWPVLCFLAAAVRCRNFYDESDGRVQKRGKT